MEQACCLATCRGCNSFLPRRHPIPQLLADEATCYKPPSFHFTAQSLIKRWGLNCSASTNHKMSKQRNTESVLENEFARKVKKVRLVPGTRESQGKCSAIYGVIYPRGRNQKLFPYRCLMRSPLWCSLGQIRCHAVLPAPMQPWPVICCRTPWRK